MKALSFILIGFVLATTNSLADKVLILAPTVSGGASSLEAQTAVSLGFTVDVVSPAVWATIPASGSTGFSSYRAIILGDPSCGPLLALAAAEANRATWGPEVDGNIIVIGTDPAFPHPGGPQVTLNGIRFATDQVGKTGLYVTLSCYYGGAPLNTVVPVLDPFGVFKVSSVGCYNDAHVVATHPAMSGLTDAVLSGWSCSVHEGFSVWPGSFQVLAIAENIGTAYTGPDLSVGTPYVLARGTGLSPLTNRIALTPISASNPTNSSHTVCAKVVVNGALAVNVSVNFTVTAGPNAGINGTVLTDPSGIACFTYFGSGGVGTDTIIAEYTNPLSQTFTSNPASKTWFDPCGATSLSASVAMVNCDSNRLLVFFNELVDPVGALDPLNYTLDNGFTVNNVTFASGSQSSVWIEASQNFISGTVYTLQIFNVNDLCGRTIVPNPLTIPFSCELICPYLKCPSNIVVQCAGPGGTPVDYDVEINPLCSNYVVSCYPPPHSYFPGGVTYVSCMIYGINGAIGSNTCSFTVTVTDPLSPIINCPDPITVYTCSNQARVFFTVTASDNCDPSVPVISTPPSGSLFSPGTTTVNCVATDASGNTANCSFTVTVVANSIVWASRLAGKTDCYKLPFESAPKSLTLWNGLPGSWKLFDETTVDRRMGVSFLGLPSTIQCAQLWIRMKPNCSGTNSAPNDTLSLGFTNYPPGPSRAAWTNFIGGGNPFPGLITNTWCGQSNCAQTFSLNLASLPNGAFNLLPLLNNRRQLDILVQDDTTVDYARLCYCYCREKPVADGWTWDVADAGVAFGHGFTWFTPLVEPGYPTNFSVSLVPGTTRGIQFELLPLDVGSISNASLVVRGQRTLESGSDGIRLSGDGTGVTRCSFAGLRAGVSQVFVILRNGTNFISQGYVPVSVGSNFLSLTGDGGLTEITVKDFGGSYRLVLGGIHSASLMSGPAALIDTIDVILIAPSSAAESQLSSLTLDAENLDGIRLANATVQVNDSFPAIFGDVEASASGDQLSLMSPNAGNPGPIGTELSLPDPGHSLINIKPVFNLCQSVVITNGGLTGVFSGKVNGVHAIIGLAELANAGSDWTLHGNLAGIGSSNVVYHVLDHGTLVADTTGQPAPLITMSELPEAWMVSSVSNEAVISLTWAESQPVFVDGVPFSADEVRILPAAPVQPVFTVTSARFDAVGAESLVLSSITPVAPAWVFRPPLVSPAQMTLEWDGPPTGTLESAPSILGPWTTVSSGQLNNRAILGSPLTNNQPARFFRVRGD